MMTLWAQRRGIVEDCIVWSRTSGLRIMFRDCSQARPSDISQPVVCLSTADKYHGLTRHSRHRRTGLDKDSRSLSAALPPLVTPSGKPCGHTTPHPLTSCRSLLLSSSPLRWLWPRRDAKKQHLARVQTCPSVPQPWRASVAASSFRTP